MLNRIYNKIISVVILIFVLYIDIFLVSGLYDLTHNIDTYNYETNKSFSIPEKRICAIFKCNNIRSGDTSRFYDKNNFVYTQKVKHDNLKITEYYYIDMESLEFNVKAGDYYVYTDMFINTEKKITVFLFSLPILLIMLIVSISRTIREEQESKMVQTAGNEAILTNKSMIMITENIHHELNTPLEVIDNKISKINKIVTEFLMAEERATKYLNYVSPERQARNRNLVALEEDFDFIQTSSEQIYTVLEKMKGFKHLRYSNGNKTIKSIITGGFKIINISVSNFEYTIDNKLSKYKIDNTNFKNADLLNIVLNHIKNSLEANSSKIVIAFNKFSFGYLYIRIIDNGNGIVKISKEDIFKPNFSSKSEENGIRGNGMYLNKQILKQVGGDVKLIDSTVKGTTIELKIPCKVKS